MKVQCLAERSKKPLAATSHLRAPCLVITAASLFTAPSPLAFSESSLQPTLASSPARLRSTPTESAERHLAEAVDTIRHADYRGDREQLRRQAQDLSAPTTPGLEQYREYWRGFAYWRRVLNGFNETPTPDDLFSDAELATAAFRAALRLDPTFEDAKSALAGCLMNEMFLVSAKPSDLRTKVYEEGIAAVRAVKESAQENPRSLWIIGGNEMGAPPPWGGDMAKAAALYERGLAAARREGVAGARAPWMPSWGAAESLMSLAYLYSHGSTDREVARAYALGALAVAPDWHYVADILLPAIEALPSARATAAAQPDGSLPVKRQR